MRPKKVAIIHYWLVGMRGGEKVVEQFCHLFPEADIFTHVYDPLSVSQSIRRHRVKETFVGRLPLAKRLYRHYLPLMPLALESLDLSNYDLIISSEAGPAKGVIPSPESYHICYCHSPMRYIWDQYHVYRSGVGMIARHLMPVMAARMRLNDVASAARVDQFVANSSYVAKRIEKYYRRESVVVHPPVDVDAFSAADSYDDFYLWAGELVRYKRPDIAIEAFNSSGRRLIVIGDGPEMPALKKVAKDNIVFLGRTDFATLRKHFARCRALVFPGVEDFGIIPVEVMASGRPVIAFARGGVLDTVIDGVTGVLYSDLSASGLNNAIREFEASDIGSRCVDACLKQARKFSEQTFQERIREIVANA